MPVRRIRDDNMGHSHTESCRMRVVRLSETHEHIRPDCLAGKSGKPSKEVKRSSLFSIGPPSCGVWLSSYTYQYWDHYSELVTSATSSFHGQVDKHTSERESAILGPSNTRAVLSPRPPIGIDMSPKWMVGGNMRPVQYAVEARPFVPEHSYMFDESSFLFNMLILTVAD